MSKFTKLIYVLLFIALVLHPHFVPDHIGIFPRAYAESIITSFIIALALLMYYLHKRDLKRKDAELKTSTERLAESFKYIGLVNRRLPLLKSLTSDLLANSKLSKKEKNKIFQDLLATALISVAKVNWGLLRFINTDSGKTAKEFIFTAKNYVVMQNSIGNKELLQSRQQTAAIKTASDLFIIPTTEQEAVIQGHLVFPKPAESLEDERWILQAITDQAQLFFKYLFNKFIMDHNHDQHQHDNQPRHAHCKCGKECLSCKAEELSVDCGCAMEAKQYEYDMPEKLSHGEHDHKDHSNLQAAETIYTCPMHPEVRKTQPGKCPGCGMDLIPASAEATTDKSEKKGMDHGQHADPDMQAMSHMDHEAAMTNPQMAKKMEADMRRRFWVSFLLAIPIFLLSPVGAFVFKYSLPDNFPVNWILLALTTPIVFWTGSIFITGTYYSLKAKKLNMAVLIATGVLAAYLFSVLLTFIGSKETFYEAAALLVTFVLFGHWMEMKSRKGTSDSLRALFDLVPPKATVVRNGKEITIPSAEITKDDIVVIRPGDKVPVDGEVVEGSTSIDESLVTGESLPVTKNPGDKVVGGSVNVSGIAKFKAVKVGSDTVLAQIIKMVETAQNSKAPGQRIADKAAGWLVIVAIGSGLLAFFGWYFIGNATFLVALTFAVSTVVIACPDALGLATPTAVAVGTGIGAKHNILIKDAATLENTSRLTAIVLDKTGTLTEGKPKVTDVLSFSGFSPDQVVEFEAGIESGSNHPIAKSIVDEADNRKLSIKQLTNFESIAGFGLKGVIDGKAILAGNEKLMDKFGVNTGTQRTTIDRLAGQGKTLSLLAVDGKLAGIVAVADTVKPSSKRAIAAMKALGLEVAMITGDHTKVAEAVAKDLGIDRVFAEVLPGDKAKHVKQLQDEGKFVAMVGDGINDAPALAQADIGIAIGAGTDVAIETGNIVLMKSDPYDIVAAIRLSKATVTKMKQNLFWAAIYNLLAIPVAAGVFYNSFGVSLRPEIAALLMSASSIIVATNAVLLKRVEKKLAI